MTIRHFQILALGFVVSFTNCWAEGTVYLSDETGRPCVSSTKVIKSSSKHVEIYFQNICPRNFSYVVVPTNSPQKRGTGIGPGSPSSPSTSYITCDISDGCQGGDWYVK